MNTADFERYLSEMIRIGHQNAPLAKAWMEVQLFLFEHWLPIFLLALVWYGLHLHALWTNLRDNIGIDRLTWLVTLCLPWGLIFYWCLGRPSHGGNATVVTTSPPARTERDTASDITAALAEESRKRRDRQS